MTPELQRVLWACYQCWASSPVPPDQRMICYEWISGAYRDKFAAVIALIAPLFPLTPKFTTPCLGDPFLPDSDALSGKHSRGSRDQPLALAR